MQWEEKNFFSASPAVTMAARRKTPQRHRGTEMRMAGLAGWRMAVVGI
jgi:hypothetical protein